MSVGAICFTSSGSNGGCWVVLVFPRLFFGKMGFFFPYATYAKKKKVYATYTKKKISVEKKNATYAKKKKLRDLRQKKKKKSDLRLFPQSSYAFLQRSGQKTTLATALFGHSLTTRGNEPDGWCWAPEEDPASGPQPLRLSWSLCREET